MKSLRILLAALCVAVTSARAQEPSPFRFDATERDFGEVREESGSVSHTFVFTNSGAIPVAIDRAVASCGCTTSEYPRTPVAPGASASIKVTFDPEGMPGEFSKSIAVVSGGGKFRDFLIIKGRVVPRPKTVEEEFPYDMGGGVRLSNTLFTFRGVAQGRSAAMAADYINTGTKSVTFALETVEGSGFLATYAPETICAGCRGDITFTYDLSTTSVYGSVHDVLRPVIDGTASLRTLYTAMTGIDDFTGVDVADAPRFFLDASFHDFGTLRRRVLPYTFRLVASNEGSEMLHIRSVSVAEGLQTTLRAGMTIAPGATLPFEVMMYSNKYAPGEVRGTIDIVVNDPARPIREIRTAAVIE